MTFTRPCTQCGHPTRSLQGLCHDCRGDSKGRGVPVKAQTAEAALTPEQEAQALCAQTDPELWFPNQGESPAMARRICSGCPVAGPCLEVALANDERFGIWGGLAPRERHALTTRRAS